MDKLKEILNQKKAQVSGQKWVKIGDIEKERAEQYRKEQEAKEREKQEKLKHKLEETEEYFKELEKKQKKFAHGNKEPNMLEPSPENHPEGEPPIPKSDVIKRLRARNQPITLFGETDWMRYERLMKVETEKIDDHVKLGGQQNIFQKDLQMTEDEFKKIADLDEDDGLVYEDIVKYLESKKKVVNFDAPEFKGRKKPSLSEGVSMEEKCKDVYYWCRKVLLDWEKDFVGKVIEEMSESEEAKSAIGQFRQCRRNMKPLFLLLRNHHVNDEILDALYHIVHYCLLKEYVRAHDKYLELSIGNAPWPMGVTSVGIHERSGRTRLFSSQIAHILNDETQRKYLQAIKRLMTVAQKKDPADYSRNVNMSI